MQKNVNLLQNPIEYDKYVEEYIIQALANLGQRIGIKGDGLSYNYFSFNDIIGDSTTYSSTNHLGFIQYKKSLKLNKYVASFGVCNYDDETGETYNEKQISESLNINDVLYFPNDLEFNITLGNIEKYSKNSICINDNSDLTFMLVGKLMGTNDNDDLNSVLYYYKFDINSNLLKYGTKIYYDYSDDTGDWFHMINIINKSYKANNYKNDVLSDEYEMNINIFNARTLKELNNAFYRSFMSSFNFYSYNSTNDIPFSLIKPEYVDISELLNYNDVNDNYFYYNSPIAIILNYLSNSLYDKSSINLIYNSNKNEFFSINSDDFEKIIALYKSEYDINLSEELYLLNEDCNNLYNNIFNYYNEKYYFDNRITFIKRILSKLYENISNHNYDNEFKLYVPLDYQFHYICNSNDNIYIYYSTNTYVTFTNLSAINTTNFWSNNTNLIFDYNNDISKVKIYNFEINYNSNNEKLINSIIIKDVFTMPYINGNDNWSINDTDTKVRAAGKDAGNPNIIIIYNKDISNLGIDQSFYVLNAISNSKEINAADYEQKWFNVNPALFDNTYSVNIKCCTYIPQITKNNFEYFKNSIILSISDLNCLEDESHKPYYKGSYILTMWHLTETSNDSYEFICINTVDTNYALALGSTVNLINATSDSNIENINDQDLVLLKAIVTELAQQRLSVSENNWMIIKNKQSEEYINNTSQYSNDLNGIIQYNDTIKISNNHIIHSQTNKYISSLNNIKTTNSLYPKYYKTTSTVNKNVKETINELRNVGKIITNNRLSKVYITTNNDTNVTEVQNVESMIQTIENNYTETQREIEYKITLEQLEKANYNYNEFIFNENVPTLDFGEVFNRNFNVLNRVNVVSLDNNGNAYNAYIGTSFDEQNKSTLHIGSSNTNINIGSETLIDNIDKTNFNVHDSLSLDFNNIILNASNKIISKQNFLYQANIGGITYNIMNVPLIGMCSSAYGTSLFTTDNMNVLDTRINDVNVSLYKLSLNNLFSTLFGIDLPSNINNISLNLQNIQGVIYYNNTDKLQYPQFNDDMYYIVTKYKSKNKVHIIFNNKILNSNNVINGNIVYCNCILNIMYYIVYDENTSTNKYNIYLSIS